MNLTDGILYSNLFPSSGGGAGAVDSVNGMTGAVTITKGTVGLGNVDNTSDVNKPISTATQTALDLKATMFVGICEKTPIGANDISIDYTSRVLTITPPLGYFDFFTDGNGVTTKHRKTGAVNFPAFTDTSGVWYFHFDNDGNAVTTQTAWTDYSVIATVYRLYWNSALSGAEKSVIEALETHMNNISVADHEWKHRYGSIWVSGFEAVHNKITSGSPNADGRNTVISLTSGSNMDDNIKYTVTNGTGSNKFEQDLGHTTAGTLTALNSGLFKIRSNNVSGILEKLPATRFPFDWNSGTNIPQYITTSGVRTPVSNGYYFVYFIYAIQEPRNGETVKIVSDYREFSSLINAQASTWDNMTSVYTTLTDNEIRPMYKLIFEYKSSYDAGCKYSALRQVDDIRRTRVTVATSVAGSVLASSVVVTSTEDITSTNAQSAFVEVDRRNATIYADLAAIKAKDTTGLINGKLANVLTLGMFRYDSSSTATGNDVTIITPTTGSGRWLKYSNDIKPIATTVGQTWSTTNQQLRINEKIVKLMPYDVVPKRIVGLGSSVMLGTGVTNATTDPYFALMLTELGGTWTGTNVSISGNTSSQAYSRFLTDVVPFNPDIVWIGLSPNNNGLSTQTTVSGCASVIKTYLEYLDLVIKLCKQYGYEYIISGMYPKNDYTAVAYGALKDLNAYLSKKHGNRYIDFLSVLDDGTGKLKTAIDSGDGTHPNTAGHVNIKECIPESLHKYVESRARNDFRFNTTFGLKLGSDTSTAKPLECTESSPVRNGSFAIGFDVKGTFVQDNVYLYVSGTSGTKLLTVTVNASGNFELRNNGVALITTSIPPVVGYNRVVLNYDARSQIFTLYVNGASGGNSAATSYYYQHFSIGGGSVAANNAVNMEFRNICKWCCKLSTTQITGDANGTVYGGSLEFFNPLNNNVGTIIENDSIAFQMRLLANSSSWALATS